MGLNINDTQRIVIGAAFIAAGVAGDNPQLIQIGVGLILSAAASTPRTNEINNRSVSHRGAIEPWRVVYGIHKIGGVYTFIHLTGTNNEFLNLVIALAGHKVFKIGDSTGLIPNRIYLNGQPVDLDGSGNALTPPDKLLMDPTDVDVGNNKFLFTAHGYTTNMRVRYSVAGGSTLPGNVIAGQPYFISRINADEFAITKRFITDESTDDHFVDITSIGSGTWSMELDVDTVINYVDHLTVEVKQGDPSQTAITNLINEVGDTGIWSTAHRLRGRAYAWIRLKWNRDKFPQGVPNISFDIQGKEIWDPRIGGNPTTDIAFSSNPALIIIDYLMNTDYGLGATQSEISESRVITAAQICDELVPVASPETGNERRYEANGSFKISQKPSKVIKELLSSMSGELVRVGGKWEVYAGAAVISTENYDESDFSAGFKVQTLIDRRDNANGVRGTFVSPLDNWQPASYIEVKSAGALSGDQGKENFRELSFPWTISFSTAQRLALIELRKLEETLSLNLQGKLTMFKSQPPDVIQLTNERMSWVNKEFKISDANLVISNEGALNYQMRVREYNAAVYNWDETADESPFDQVRNSLYPSPFIISAPTNLILESGTDILFLRLDGTIFSRIKATWTAPTDEFVILGGTIEVQIKKSADLTFIDAPIVTGSETETFLLDVEDGVSYDVRIRSRNTIGTTSPYITVSNHVVIGKTTPPEDVANFQASQNEATVVMTWSQVSDKDLGGYDIHYARQGTGAIFDTAFKLTQINKGTSHTTAALPPGNWTLYMKAVDTTGNRSVNAAVTNVRVLSFNPVIKGEDEDILGWSGSKKNFVKHHTQALFPTSQVRASGDNFDVFDIFVQNPFPESIYTTEIFDLGREGTVRIYADIVASLGPEPGSGETITVRVETRFADAGGVFSAWAELQTVNKVFAQFIQYRFKSDNGDGVAFYNTFLGAIDVEPRTEGQVDIEVPVEGLIIVFEEPFFVLPRIKVTPQGLVARYAGFADRSLTQFTIKVFDFQGSDVAGTVDWEATTLSLVSSST